MRVTNVTIKHKTECASHQRNNQTQNRAHESLTNNQTQNRAHESLTNNKTQNRVCESLTQQFNTKQSGRVTNVTIKHKTKCASH